MEEELKNYKKNYIQKQEYEKMQTKFTNLEIELMKKENSFATNQVENKYLKTQLKKKEKQFNENFE